MTKRISKQAHRETMVATQQTGTRLAFPAITPELQHGKPIEYFEPLADDLSGWASAIGVSETELRSLTELAIRNRYSDAIVDCETRIARGKQPCIYTLGIGPAYVYFARHPDSIVVYGYSYENNREPLDDWDGGGHYRPLGWS